MLLLKIKSINKSLKRKEERYYFSQDITFPTFFVSLFFSIYFLMFIFQFLIYQILYFHKITDNIGYAAYASWKIIRRRRKETIREGKKTLENKLTHPSLRLIPSLCPSFLFSCLFYFIYIFNYLFFYFYLLFLVLYRLLKDN